MQLKSNKASVHRELSRKGVAILQLPLLKQWYYKTRRFRNIFVRGLGDRYSTTMNGLPIQMIRKEKLKS
jgi:hypothetical protein